MSPIYIIMDTIYIVAIGAGITAAIGYAVLLRYSRNDDKKGK